MDKQFEEAFAGMKKGFEEFKAANDLALAGQTDKFTQVDKILADLEENVKTVQAKVARQNAQVVTNESGMKFLADINLVRAKQGKPAMAASDMDNYAEVLAKFIRARGNVGNLSDVEAKALREGVDSEGGYYVTPQMANAMIEKDFETSPMERFATIENTTSNRYGYYVDFDEFSAEYTSELKARGLTKTAELGKLFIDVHSVYLKIPVSNELLEDAGVDINSWIMRKANEKEVRIRNQRYITGSGSLEEQGILSAPSIVGGEGKFGQIERIYTGANSLDYDDLINLFAELHDTYHANASLLMSRQLFFKDLIKIKDLQNRYIVDIFGADGIPKTLAGYNIGFMSDMAKNTTVSAQDLIVFGDIKRAYTIVKRRGLTLLADPYSLDGGVMMKMDSRGGAGVTNSQAVKILRRKV